VPEATGTGKLIWFFELGNVPTIAYYLKAKSLGHGDARNVLVRAVHYLFWEENLPKSNASSLKPNQKDKQAYSCG